MILAQIQTIPEVLAISKVLILALLSFTLAMALTPLLAHFLYKYKIGIQIKEKSVSGEKLSYVNKMHAHKSGTPTMGGILIWGTVFFLATTMYFLAPFLSEKLQCVWLGRLDFVSRSQTWLPLFALATTAMLGLADDWMSIKKIGSNKGGGMRFAWRFAWMIAISLLGAWWFYNKLGWDTIHIPAIGDFIIGLWYIPLFIFVIVSTAISSNETDGLDGLNAGILAQAFVVFAIISVFQDKMNLAAFCAVVAGSIVAFLWFNFYPARFFMGDTGAISLGATLGVVAILTDSVIALPFVVSIYCFESISVVIQMFSKKFFKRKVFLAAPIHHHFEAKGWHETKVTVRFWIINAIIGLVGLIIGIVGSGL
ncbi:phospho-N-acetylmuramoyl-pentapeptide-transferase [bacterium]|jgi:phospho-N-acetylmuramoyl-pentapeptide-transferase|nr:phospho-N-acetylmuramoyl-pentapeptide-transferase [bacterium]MBT4251170.1 phospho-N-acetylmuramoyl-pentapeptide-transferase [bacterium]MBT4598038.1 phospho-N-acetylmuramoyl-pentapeptide-transferase [bacterium]MBT6753550.1 phospho-N-acetylmuramoyl-pentapeptide-transferase [bacterium]MBT7037665.1 phospho-N-acetylmuramoyl-pentapeptide-transferase [bacterium]